MNAHQIIERDRSIGLFLFNSSNWEQRNHAVMYRVLHNLGYSQWSQDEDDFLDDIWAHIQNGHLLYDKQKQMIEQLYLEVQETILKMRGDGTEL